MLGNRAESTLWFGYFVAISISFFGDFLHLPYGSYASQRVLLCLYLVVFASLGVWHLMMRAHLKNTDNLSFIFVAISAFLFLIHALFSDGYLRWIEPMMFALFIVGSVYFGAVINDCLSYKKVVSGFLIITITAMFFYAGMTVNYYLFTIADKNFDVGEIIPWGFFNIRYWSHTATWLIPILPLAIKLSLPGPRRLRYFFVCFTAAIWIWILLMSTARGSIISLSVGTIVAFLVFGRNAFPWAKIQAFFILIGVGGWLLLSIILPSVIFGELEVRSISTSTSGRLSLWAEAFEMSLQNFPLGMGSQSWLTHDLLTSMYIEAPKFGHPHNMYLMWAAEYGWLTVFALSLVAVSGTKHLRHKRDLLEKEASSSDEYQILIALTVSVVAGAFHAGLSAVFMAPASMLIALFLLALFWSAILPTTVRNGLAAPGLRRLMPRVFVMLCVLGISVAWLAAVFSYHKEMESDLAYYYENVPGGLMPRFWLHGNFPRNPGLAPDLLRKPE